MAEQMISNAVSRVLASKPMMMSHPSSAALTDFYPSVSSATSHLVEAVNRCGSVRLNSNNKTLNSTSNFSISSSLLLYNPTLNLSFTLPANHIVFDGWGLQAIDSFEISFANSLAQNMIISGSALRDLLLYSQCDPEKRQITMRQCGRASTANVVQYASIPLVSLINRAQISNTFPLDFSTFNGFMQFNITWKTPQAFIMVNSTNPGTAFPTQWTTCELVFCSSAITDGGFSIKNSLMMNPLASYNIPETWISNYKYDRSITVGASNTTELTVTSCPKGQCHGFLMSVFPKSEITATANGQTLTYPSGVLLSYLRVQYNGVDLFRANSYQEISAYNRYKHDGDDLSFGYTFYTARNAANVDLMNGQIYFVPFNYHSSLVRSHNHSETLPSYDGASIQIEFSVDTGNREYVDAASPFTTATLATAGAGGAEDYSIEIVWLLSSLVEVTQSGVDIQR